MVVATADARPAGPARGPSCSRGTTRAASCSTPTTTRARAPRLAANPYASLVFPWFPMQRQVVVAGRGRAGRPGRDRGVLRHPPARLAARRLGQPAVAGGRRTGPRWTTRYARAAERFAGDEPYRRRRTGAACGCARDSRVLAGPGRPAARPAALPAATDGRERLAVTSERLGAVSRGSDRTVTASSCLRRHAIDTAPAAPCPRTGGCSSATPCPSSGSSSPRSPCRCRCSR